MLETLECTPVLITKSLIQTSEKVNFMDTTFYDVLQSIKYEMRLYETMEILSNYQYTGGSWDIYSLSNKGFYLELKSDCIFEITSFGGIQYECSAQTASIVANICTLNELCWEKNLTDPQKMHSDNLYHLLKDFAAQHIDAKKILSLID